MTIVIVGFVMVTSAIFSEPPLLRSERRSRGIRRSSKRWLLARRPHAGIVWLGQLGAALGLERLEEWRRSRTHPVILPHDSVSFALAFSPDGKRLVSGGP